MKKTAILILIAVIIQMMTLTLGAVNQTVSKPFVIGSKSTSSLDVSFKVPDFEIEEETVAGVTYNRIKMDEAGYLIEAGMPELPVLSTMIAIPNHGQVQVEVVDTHEKMLQHIMPYPSQDGNTNIIQRGIEINQSFYQGSDTYPQELIKYSDPQILRDFRIITVQIQPFSWDAATHKLTVKDRVDFRLRYTNSPGINELEGPQIISPSFTHIYESMILNFDDYRNVIVANTPPRYLIIYGANTNTAFQTSLNNFVFWKKQKGADVRLVSTSVAGSSNTAIKTFIQNIYNDVNARPDYIVFVGDVQGSFPIPTFSESWSGLNGNGDYPYTQLAGSDFMGDVFIGRISAMDTSQLDVIFSKIYYYERDISVANAQWLNRMLLVGDTNPSGIGCQYTMKNIKDLSYELNPDYTYNEQYGDPAPASMDAGINAGVGFFWYRGYIGMSSWSPSTALVNGIKTPHSIIVTCATGNFAGGESTTEKFVRGLGSAAVPAGAVTAIGMETSHTNPMCNNMLEKGMAEGIFAHGMRSMGEALLNGKLLLSRMYGQNHTWVADYSAHWCNLIGDPTMEVYCGIPSTFTTNLPSTLAMGTNNLELIVLNQETVPVSNACVTISQNTVIMARGFTDESGRVVLFLNNVLSAGTAIVTVSKHDYKPLQQSITISGSGSLVTGLTMIDDDNVGSSVGNSNFAANSGETLEVLFSLRNTTSAAINDVNGHVFCSSSYVEIDTTTVLNFSNIDPGMSNYSLNPLLVTILPNCPNNTTIKFELRLTDSTNTAYILPDFITVTDAYMSFVSYQVIDGNNQALDPNESSPFSITLKNNGSVPVNGLYGQLVTQNDLVQVQDNIGFFGDLLVGAQVSTVVDLYQLQGRSQMLPGMLIPMRLKLYNDAGFIQWLNFNLTVGSVTSTDPVGPDNYGYVIYDITDTGYEDCPTYEWIGIAPAEGGQGTLMSFSDNSVDGDGEPVGSVTTIQANLPFAFTFYGRSYNQITVCSNGFIAMGTTENGHWTNCPLPGYTGPNALIAAFWDDLMTGNGGVYKWYDSVNHKFIVEWYNMKNGFNQSSIETFQVILYDPVYYPTSLGDGPIKIQYNTFNNVDYIWAPNNLSVVDGSGNFATVGIQSYNQTTGLEYSFNNVYPTAAAALGNQKALYITNSPIYHYSPHLLYDSSVVIDNNNNVAEPGETVDLGVNLLNIGEQTATGINAVLTSTDPFVTISGTTSPYAPISQETTGANIYPFRFTVSNTCPDKHVIPFVINISTGDNNWLRTFNITVEKPSLEYYSYYVADVNGNNNGVADPGETATIVINARNKSLVDASVLSGNLTTMYAGITITNPIINKSLLSPGEITQFAYQVTIDQTVTSGANVPFTFNLTSSNAPVVNQNISIPCGTSGMILDFESTNGNFTTDSGWQFGTTSQTTPHSGMNLWGTSLVGQYPSNAMMILKTPVIHLPDNASMSFWHMMSCQNYYDGGNVSISTNGGDSWTLLYPVAGYNTSLNVYSLGEIGFTNQVAWSQVNFNLNQYANSDVIIRWRFGSNASVQGNGWYIDDVMISGYHINTGIVNGIVTLSSPANREDVKLITQNRFVTNPDSTGAYQIYLPVGTHELTASMAYHTSQTSTPITISNEQQTYNYDFTLGYLPEPTNLVLGGVQEQPNVSVSWTAPVEPGYTITGYKIYRKLGDHPYQLAGQSNETSFTEELSLDGRYIYYIRALYAEGEGAPCDTVGINFPFPIVANGDEPTPMIVTTLNANYPNPFNPTTSITYGLAKQGNVAIRIYNTKGQLVKILEQGTKKAGNYKVVWDGTNDKGKPVSSGLYFFRMDAPNYTNTRKMMLLK